MVAGRKGHRPDKACMTEGPVPGREQPLNVNLQRNPALSAIIKTPGGADWFTQQVRPGEPRPQVGALWR
jgi:hypothetical protein